MKDPLTTEIEGIGGHILEVTPNAKWVSLRVIVIPGMNIKYDYAHEEQSRGNIVSLLPYRVRPDGVREFLIRSEVVPPWGMSPHLCSVMGSWDKDGEDFPDVAVREMEEETGYKITLADLIPLGTCKGTKALDTVYHLFSVDLTGMEPGIATGDGSEIEALADNVWMESLEDVSDPLIPTMALRLLTKEKL